VSQWHQIKLKPTSRSRQRTSKGTAYIASCNIFKNTHELVHVFNIKIGIEFSNRQLQSQTIEPTIWIVTAAYLYTL
jgi:hypothetical protein